jgi:hypothetical protein
MLAEVLLDFFRHQRRPRAARNYPMGWDETEMGRYLVHRAELFTRTADRLRRKAYEQALRSRRL